MSAGIKLYNANRQVLIDSNYFNFAHKNSVVVSAKNFVSTLYLENENDTLGKFEFSGKHPLLVYELGNHNHRIAITRMSNKDGIYQVEFIFKPNDGENRDLKFHIFDVPEFSDKSGQSAVRLYNQNQELTFDSQLKYLQILGEITPDMALNPNKKYGVLLRSKLQAVHVFNEYYFDGGRKWRMEQKALMQMLHVQDSILKSELVEVRNHSNWYWTATGRHRPIGYNETTIPTISQPLLVDLSLIS